MDSKKISLLGILLLAIALAAGVQAETLAELKRPFTGELQSIGIELTKAGDIDIDAIGLRPRYRDDFLVYAWIIDYNTRKPVWEMNVRRADRIRSKKILYQEETTRHFEKGKYELYLYAGGTLFSSVSIDGPNSFFDFVGDLFSGDDNLEDYDDLLDECYVTLSSSDLSGGDVKTFEVTGGFPNALIRHNRLKDSEYIEDGFSLSKPENLHIYSIIELPKGDESPVDYGWIVDADTRKKVWEMDDWNTDYAGGGDKNRIFDDDVSLDKGNYVLYFVTDDSHSFEEFNVNPPYDPFNWGITILPGKDFDRSAFKEYQAPGYGDPLVEFTKVRDDEYFEQPFKLTRSTDLHVYSIGEYSRRDREFVDYGWILDAATGKMVWEMTAANTEHAGGDEKNRMFDGYVTLPEGEYIVSYVTDDSHAYRDWNASPPFNPKAWGIAIYPGHDYKKGSFQKISETEVAAESNLLVNLTRVRDNERRHTRFTLDRETKLHIYALGEGDRDEFHDYAWIEDAKTGRSVWEMTWRNTFHAGGARKNRVFDDDIILDAGTYEVYYITDGSHAFNDWNAARPDDPFNWGIKISKADD